MLSELTPAPSDLGHDRTIRGFVAEQRVFNRYVLRRILGRGGMGIVWLAHDQRLDREVALKFLPEEINFDPAALDELKRETRRCLDLTHPNILRIYDFVEDGQAAAISMEYIDGKTLAELRVEKKERFFEVDEIREWIAQACAALHYAHQDAGVVHRDLKPANLMLTSRGQIKVADFGIAQSMGDSMSRMTMRRGTSGTLAYMSPQQLNGELSRIPDDVYAMGTTIYELLTSKPPFYMGDIPFQVRLSLPKTLSVRRDELELRGQKIPPDWESAIIACLAKVPEERPANMLDLAERLGLSIGVGRPATTVRVKVPGPFIKEQKSKRIGPPPLPRRPLFQAQIRQKIIIAAAGVVVALISGIIALHFLWPFIAPRGDIRLTSTPPGALVHIAGFSDQKTPAHFTAVRIGSYEVGVSAAGFVSAQRIVSVGEGAHLNLGEVQLERSLGGLDLRTTPMHVHFTLKGTRETQDFQQEGMTPAILASVPSGSYQLNLDTAGIKPVIEALQVPEQGILRETADLIQLSILHEAGAQPASAFRGEIGVSQLNAADKNELTSLLDRAFNEYLNRDLLSFASAQLARLQGLGQDVRLFRIHLERARISRENSIATEIRHLLAQKKFATAKDRLDALADSMEPVSVDRLSAEFQAPLAQYQQQIGSAIASNRSAPPAIAYRTLKTLCDLYPDDVQVQLALANAQRQMSPDHDRLVSQLKSIHQIDAQTENPAEPSDLRAVDAMLTTELKQLDALENTLNIVKDGPRQLRRLEDQKDILEQRKVGPSQTNPFAEAVNFFGKVVVGHAVVDTVAYFPSREAKEEAIGTVKAQIDALKAGLTQPQGSLQEAQRNYDDFVARVPWGDIGKVISREPDAPPLPPAIP